MGKRPPAPFVAIDCATIPGDLAESEPFGYEDSASTGRPVLTLRLHFQ
jgi:transcriptional regulator with PAS, ATPase and Fis domain